MLCSGCEKELSYIDIGYSVCFDCTRARQAAVLWRKCRCKKIQQRPGPIKQIGSRKWIDCLRCLGHIQQLS